MSSSTSWTAGRQYHDREVSASNQNYDLILSPATSSNNQENIVNSNSISTPTIASNNINKVITVTSTTTTTTETAPEKPDNTPTTFHNHADSSLIHISDISQPPSTGTLPSALILLTSSSPSDTKDAWLQSSLYPGQQRHHNHQNHHHHHQQQQQQIRPTTISSATGSLTTSQQQSAVSLASNNNNNNNSKLNHDISDNQSSRIQFKSLLTPAVISESDEILLLERNGQELINFSCLKQLDSDSSNQFEFQQGRSSQLSSTSSSQTDNKNQQTQLELEGRFSRSSSNTNHSADDDDDDHELNNDLDNDDHSEDNDRDHQHRLAGDLLNKSPSRYKPTSSSAATFTGRLLTKFKFFGAGLTNKLGASNNPSATTTISYTPFVSTTDGSDTKDLLTGTTKYRAAKRHSHQHHNNHNHNYYKKTNSTLSGRTFRGSYRYSRLGIVMALFKKVFSFLIQKSTLALFGAFLIHVTLGTVYTLSNINSYLTSYMRKHGTPNATYGGSMWISSSYAVGQGFSMVLGGYIEKRFSARLSCILGCLLHSMSIMSTSKTIDHGHVAVLLSYGFLPGFGCGLAYMTPMSNGFGWFPHRKGLVAGVILAGFGIGTFVFNMAQTAFVNPNNLSPLVDSGGYFTQDSVLNNVPGLFIFMGTIYAAMQFIGCCLLFKPPHSSTIGPDGKLPQDEKPILVDSEITFDKAIKMREFWVLFVVFGITNQGVLFVNSMLKEYGQIFINNDLFLAWTGSMASIANSMGRLTWGLAIDRFSFTQCFTSITTIFGILMFLMPFEFVLSSKLLYLLCTLGIFGSFSGWMSTYPVHLSRIFGVQNSGMIYGLIFVSQSIGGIFTAFGAHYLIDNYSRFVPFFCVAFLELLGLAIYHLFYFK